jgi:hypothetical protein
MHGLHAFYLPVQVLPEVRLILDHLDGYQLERKELAFLVLYEIDVSVGALAQSALVLVLVQKHQILYNSNLSLT